MIFQYYGPYGMVREVKGYSKDPGVEQRFEAALDNAGKVIYRLRNATADKGRPCDAGTLSGARVTPYRRTIVEEYSIPGWWHGGF